MTEDSFGSGVRFLEVWRDWQNSRPRPGTCLHFVAAASGPLHREELLKAVEGQTELEPLAQELCDHYPAVATGTHRLVLDRGRVRLTLCFGDLTDACATDDVGQRAQPRVAVIGAGIAGCLLANNLAGRGIETTLIDAADTVAAGASGNRQGALYVKLGVDYNDQTELALSALLFSQRFYRQFKGQGWHPTGLVQLVYNASEADRQARFLAKNQYPPAVFQPVTAEQASQLAGIPIPHGGLWFPESGWLQPDILCNALTDQPLITQRMNFPVARLAADAAGWRIISTSGEALCFDRVIICAGPNTPELIPVAGEFRMKAIRGQITEVPETLINPPSLVVCGPGYVNPAHRGSALVGATFDLHNSDPEVAQASDRENLKMLAELLPSALDKTGLDDLSSQVRGRVAFRCTTHDYQPIAGPMKSRDGEVIEGVYLFTGLGSKGLTYSPLLAEYLADLLTGQPCCLPTNLVRRLETGRCHKPVKD
ncbi:FAD-dependent 5-carboxymethylaminomethyl-2-thiouridine(34) oxidoreductase MnmC [Marinobacter confluentis]|nr:FAD-dependent 5-carboxymethylaminomethyl-2-thiouridine(34) oxidoreductase MnmC [Marinobacter confluentis]